MEPFLRSPTADALVRVVRGAWAVDDRIGAERPSTDDIRLVLEYAQRRGLISRDELSSLLQELT